MSATDQVAELFMDLGPDQILNLVERAYACHLTNLFRPMNSYINRVYELEDDGGTGLIVKFYRPGRWSFEAIQEEHRFLLELAGEELPVVAPLVLADGTTLGNHQGVPFGLFPKRGGRSVDEFDDEQWLQLGRLLGRVHSVGSRYATKCRPQMEPHGSTRDQLNYILSSGLIPAELVKLYSDCVEEIIAETAPLFSGLEKIRIHGDCHFANIIHRPGESFYLIDFDDMVMGPPVQDIWMLLPGTLEETFVEMDILLEGYETFRSFDRRSLGLVEPLRAMRFVHYTAWCAHQMVEDGFTRVIDDFGTFEYWQREIADLKDQLERIRDFRQPGGNVA